MYHLRRLTIAIITIGTIVFAVWLLPRVLDPTKKTGEQRRAEQRWVDTSPYWLDRQTCRWLSLCGILHVKPDPPTRRPGGDRGGKDDGDELRRLELRGVDDGRLRNWAPLSRVHGPVEEEEGEEKRNTGLRGIPDYVLKYAPLVHLYSGEHFWPSDIADHVARMKPHVNGTAIESPAPLDLHSLHALDSHDGALFLKSDDDVESRPKWLHSGYNTPNAFPHGGENDRNEFSIGEDMRERHWFVPGTTWTDVDKAHPLQMISDPRRRSSRLDRFRRFRLHAGRRRPAAAARQGQDPPVSPVPQHKPDDSGYSKAPATLVLVDKGSGVVDAFWFFFYSYNLGQTVMGVRFGNHVGDWEHTMVRFESGVPRAVYLSEHEGGQAYAYHAVEKRGNATEGRRPVVYSAVGSHAMYAAPGDHPYVLPFGMLQDQTDRGPLWDPAKNLRAYWYDYTAVGDAEGLTPAAENPGAATGWFHYEGRWGDELYGLDDERQWRFFGQCHYVTGPQGPKFKNLARQRMCLNWRCRLLHSIEEGRRASWY